LTLPWGLQDGQVPPALFTIGQFSRMVRLSVNSPRRYDALGLLRQIVLALSMWTHHCDNVSTWLTLGSGS